MAKQFQRVCHNPVPWLISFSLGSYEHEYYHSLDRRYRCLLGHVLSNFLDRRRALGLEQAEFKIARYQEFLFALSAYGSNRNYSTQLDFAKSLNVISLMASEKVLKQVNALVDNYNSPEGIN